jgi:hypothetical protein
MKPDSSRITFDVKWSLKSCTTDIGRLIVLPAKDYVSKPRKSIEKKNLVHLSTKFIPRYSETQTDKNLGDFPYYPAKKNSTVCPLLEYCYAIWSPRHHIDKIEGVQRFFSKRLAELANEPYHIRLFLLNSEFLEYRRLTQDLVLCYKVHHRLFDIEPHSALIRPVFTIT